MEGKQEGRKEAFWTAFNNSTLLSQLDKWHFIVFYVLPAMSHLAFLFFSFGFVPS